MDNHIYITVRSIYDTMCSILHPGKGEEQKTEHYKLFFLFPFLCISFCLLDELYNCKTKKWVILFKYINWNLEA